MWDLPTNWVLSTPDLKHISSSRLSIRRLSQCFTLTFILTHSFPDENEWRSGAKKHQVSTAVKILKASWSAASRVPLLLHCLATVSPSASPYGRAGQGVITCLITHAHCWCMAFNSVTSNWTFHKRWRTNKSTLKQDFRWKISDKKINWHSKIVVGRWY